MFTKATKEKSRGRLAIHGPSGSGKTFTALNIAVNLGKRVALMDTEKGSASKYSDIFDFDVASITDDYHPDRCVEGLEYAGKAGYDVIVVDSGSHFWNEKGGFLDLVEAEVTKMKARGNKPDSFAAWKTVDPIYRRLIQAILSSPAHVIVTMRAKTEYERTEGNGGKTQLRKIGLAPVFRAEGQYEFDIEGMLSPEHDLVIGKTRCSALDGKVFHNPGKDFANIVKDWLDDGVEPAPVVVEPTLVDVAEAVSNAEECAAAIEQYKAVAGTLKPEVKAAVTRILKAKKEEFKASA